jgi:hypothetical protein
MRERPQFLLFTQDFRQIFFFRRFKLLGPIPSPLRVFNLLTAVFAHAKSLENKRTKIYRHYVVPF